MTKQLPINLLDFVATGELGGLSMNSSRAMVWDVLGEPPLWGGKLVSKWFDSHYHFASRHYHYRAKVTHRWRAALEWLIWRSNWRVNRRFRRRLINHAKIWNYGNLEVAFVTDAPDSKISYLSIKVQLARNPIQFEENMPMTRGDFEALLSHKQIIYTQDKFLAYCLRIGQTIQAYFDDDNQLASIYAITQPKD